MFANYLKIAFRNIFRQKGYSLINIVGLALGMACSIFLLLWVHNEQSFDDFHKNADNIYRVEQDQPSPQGYFHVNVTPYPAGPEIKANIPEIKNMSRLFRPGSMLVKFGEKAFYENSVMAVDPSFLQMFTFPLISGNSETALSEPFSIIFSETMAKKYFGNENPLGKTITINNRFSFAVSGVMEDTPQNSSIRPEMLIPFSCLKELVNIYEKWGNNYLLTWVELNNENQINTVNQKITDMVIERSIANAPANITPEDIKAFRETQAPKFKLMALSDINLNGYFGYGQTNVKSQTIKIFLILALFILLIAAINYMNLATARATSRAKEVGLRKTVGAERIHIVSQFLGESILLALISFVFSFIIVIILLPLFNNLTEKQFTINLLFNAEFFIVLVFIAIFVGILAGSYPALFMSSFSPIKVLKGTINSGVKSNLFRKTLVVFQFCLSVILLIGTIVAYQQLEFLRSKQVGYEKEHLIYIPLRGETGKSYSALKEELLMTPNVVNVSGIDQEPSQIGSNSGSAKWDGKDPNTSPLISMARIDFDFVKTMKIEMLEGRSFSNLISTDSTKGFLVNEEVLKVMGIKSGVGKHFDFQGVDGFIVGVMKNFHFQSAQFNIEPLALFYSKIPRFAVIRLQGGNIPAAIENVKSVWQKVVYGYPFEYRFIEDDFAEMYKSDEQMGEVFKYGAIFAIIIASLGLFGFASFMAAKRTKEIGIRKTLGASISNIVFLLSKEFIKWVLIANVIAWPIAYILLNYWLNDYAYRISIAWWVFLIATILTILIAIITVSYQSIKAAIANPVNSLKYE